MKTNVSMKTKPIKTAEGARAKRINPELQLRRSVMACLLFEKEFYEEGEDIASRIADGVADVVPEIAAAIAVEAREKMKLRHVPLWIVRHMAKLPEHKKLVAKTLEQVIQRADELAEFLALYWKDGRQKLSNQVKKGLALAFPKFSAYNLAKYNRDGAVKLRDVLFLCHAKPKDEEQAQVWKQLIDGKLAAPDTWEVALSAGKNKKETWERLIKEKNLGALALLRNLRNMNDAKVNEDVVRTALNDIKVERVLPYRFIAAARYAPQWEPELEKSMMKCLAAAEKLPGKTLLMIDVSGSMDYKLSDKSELTRIDAACGLAILLREIAETVTVYTFSDGNKLVPARHGFALRDAIEKSQDHSGTDIGAAVNLANRTEHDRLIIITDEQSHTTVSDPVSKKAYMINVASNQNGVGYGAWTHVDGFSEAIVDYIKAYEADEKRS